MMFQSIKSLMGSTALVAALLVTPQAFAQQATDTSKAGSSEASASPEQTAAAENVDLEQDIIVTARFRAERVQDVSTSISAFSSKDLERSGISDLSGLRSAVPGLDLADRGPSRKTPALRGVTRLSNLEDASISSPVVGIYLDEASVSSQTANQRDISSFDLERIEVLRGPQGTLYGEASMGGTIKYYTKQPNLSEVQATAQAGVSTTRFGGVNHNGGVMMNVPIIADRLGFRGVFYIDRDDGFIDNQITGKKDVNSSDRFGGRALLKFEATDWLSLSGGYHFDRLKRGASWIEDFPGDRHVISNDPTRGAARRVDEGQDDTDLYVLRVDVDLGAANLSSITSRYEREAFFRFTDNQVADGLRAALGLPFRPEALNLTNVSAGTWTQELRLVSATDSPLQYTIGAYYRDGQSTTRIQALADFLVPIVGSNLFTDFPFRIQSKQWAGFGELAYDLTDQFTVRAGGRYYRESLSVQTRTTFALPIPPFVLDDRQVDERFLPRAVVEFKPGRNHLIFASASKGARNGSFNGPVAVASIFNPGVPAEAVRVAPDELWTFEVASKNSFAGGKGRFNIAGYFTDWKDPQIRLRGPITDLAYFGNCACAAQIWGLDVDFSYEIVSGLTLSGALALIDAKTDRDFTARPAVAGGVGALVVPKGTPLPTIRDVSFTLSADYRREIGDGWSINANASWNHANEGRNFFLPASARQQAAGFDNVLPSYDLVSLRLGLDSDAFSISAYVNNLFDEDAFQYVVEGSLETAPQRPRTIGVMATARF